MQFSFKVSPHCLFVMDHVFLAVKLVLEAADGIFLRCLSLLKLANHFLVDHDLSPFLLAISPGFSEGLLDVPQTFLYGSFQRLSVPPPLKELSNQVLVNGQALFEIFIAPPEILILIFYPLL